MTCNLNSKKWFSRLGVCLALATAMTLVSCAKKTKEEGEGIPTAANADVNTLGDSDSNSALGLKTVNFPYDSFTLTAEGKDTLKNNVEIMKDKSSLKIQVEGHCDARGGIQYNLALGEKRANAVRKFMMDMGISGDRLTTISFGKEKPLDPGASEEAYAKNRRANFVVTSK